MVASTAGQEPLFRLLEICRNLSVSLDQEALLQSIAETASELTGGLETSILGYDEGADSLRFLAAPRYLLESRQALWIPLERSIAGWVFTQGQILQVPDAGHDERTYRTADHSLSFECGSVMAVPIKYRNDVLGVMETVARTGKTLFTEHDRLVLETLAAQAAISMQNARLEDKAGGAVQDLNRFEQARDEFVAITAHELRTPLGIILGHATFLRETASEPQIEPMEIILRSTHRLTEIIEEFSDAQHYKGGGGVSLRRPLAVDRLIQEVVDTFWDLAERNKLTLMMDLSRANLMIEADRPKIVQALGQLVKNALTFTNPGGRVRVAAEQLPGYVKISVSDNGIGIPARDLPHVFDRYFQVQDHLTRRHGGVGLGLSIAKDIVESHDGRIWVESVEGKGSRFSFLLPHNTAQVSAAQRVFVE